ncbi:hypothetical protein CONCODRAFT_19378 [Conidiobolus coronatus NRRL 28638]|uniref:IMS import disulfide relay-system CHCH-CHCH-like Cx9C domain-containing protein n=1 Tax=Conidiobolus coronatus (strain ATCC 28846 / CBS 209.66 / NRRL 28638) TaxID=796925 RepID=A0A137NYD2_CONC2|nr:hypothetical protein CONCODRAFT_19378 [Conidiobolus coronatus NRRL 28638]|eukprot:KXN67805.1 hypothetical protein CONCODRAFT_19378 [Conidiobolus coronatus NRRL 28638]
MKPNTTNLQAYRKGVSNLASGVAQCKEQSLLYGKCINENYYQVSKGLCSKEFELFKNCVQTKLKKKW